MNPAAQHWRIAEQEIRHLRALNAELVEALERIAEDKSVLPHYEIARAAIAKAKDEK